MKIRFAKWHVGMAVAGLLLVCASLAARGELASASAKETETATGRDGQTATPAPEDRVGSAAWALDGLRALFDFASPDGAIVKDRSGVGPPLDLRIADPESVRTARSKCAARRSSAPSGPQPRSSKRSADRTS